MSFLASVNVTKDYIVLSDALHGTLLLVWREADHSLVLQARDTDFYSSSSSGLVRDGHTLGMVVADDEGNVQQLQVIYLWFTYEISMP
jgi:CPSF A subunit region